MSASRPPRDALFAAVRLVRIAGVGVGLSLMMIGSAQSLDSPGMDARDWLFLLACSVLLLPWSRLRPGWFWWWLFGILVLVSGIGFSSTALMFVRLGTSLDPATFLWRTILGFIFFVLLLQAPAVWLLRWRRKHGEPPPVGLGSGV